MMKYLILGGSGFIGRNLIEELTKNPENTVTSFSRKHQDFDDLINKRPRQIVILNGTFGINTDFDNLTRGIDIVFHLISTTTPKTGNLNMVKEVTDNILPTINLLESCVSRKVKKLIFISSGGTIYGKTYGLPSKETDETYPICSYGIHKLTIEKYLTLFYNLYGLDYRIIRLSNPYGPYQLPGAGLGAVTTFTYNAILNKEIIIYGDGSVVRDYIYIEDAIENIINITHYDGIQKLFNLGSGIGSSLIDIINIISSILCKKINVEYMESRKTDVPYNVLDVSRYNETFGNRKLVILEDGIKKLIDYFRINGL